MERYLKAFVLGSPFVVVALPYALVSATIVSVGATFAKVYNYTPTQGL